MKVKKQQRGNYSQKLPTGNDDNLSSQQSNQHRSEIINQINNELNDLNDHNLNTRKSFEQFSRLASQS